MNVLKDGTKFGASPHRILMQSREKNGGTSISKKM